MFINCQVLHLAEKGKQTQMKNYLTWRKCFTAHWCWFAGAARRQAGVLSQHEVVLSGSGNGITPACPSLARPPAADPFWTEELAQYRIARKYWLLHFKIMVTDGRETGHRAIPVLLVAFWFCAEGFVCSQHALGRSRMPPLTPLPSAKWMMIKNLISAFLTKRFLNM